MGDTSKLSDIDNITLIIFSNVKYNVFKIKIKYSTGN